MPTTHCYTAALSTTTESHMPIINEMSGSSSPSPSPRPSSSSSPESRCREVNASPLLLRPLAVPIVRAFRLSPPAARLTSAWAFVLVLATAFLRAADNAEGCAFLLRPRPPVAPVLLALPPALAPPMAEAAAAAPTGRRTARCARRGMPLLVVGAEEDVADVGGFEGTAAAAAAAAAALARARARATLVLRRDGACCCVVVRGRSRLAGGPVLRPTARLADGPVPRPTACRERAWRAGGADAAVLLARRSDC